MIPLSQEGDGGCDGGVVWLTDEQWATIEPHLRKNQPGARRVDDQRVISGILLVLKTDCRWCDCPPAFGPSTTVYDRFNRWSRRRFWVGLLEALATSGAVTKSTVLDTTYVKAQRSAFGGKRGPKCRRSATRLAARRPNPRPHRCRRTTFRPHADARQRRRRAGRPGAARSISGSPLRPRR
jgi:transposase